MGIRDEGLGMIIERGRVAIATHVPGVGVSMRVEISARSRYSSPAGSASMASRRKCEEFRGQAPVSRDFSSPRTR
jgi:hypothetical protein